MQKLYKSELYKEKFCVFRFIHKMNLESEMQKIPKIIHTIFAA